VWTDIQKAEKADAARAAVVSQHLAAITGLEHQAAVYLANSTDRRRKGWAAEVERTQARLATERAALAAVEQSAPTGLPAVLGHGVVMLQLAALVLFQTVAVLCVRVLRDSFSAPGRASVTVEGRMGPMTRACHQLSHIIEPIR